MLLGFNEKLLDVYACPPRLLCKSKLLATSQLASQVAILAATLQASETTISAKLNRGLMVKALDFGLMQLGIEPQSYQMYDLFMKERHHPGWRRGGLDYTCGQQLLDVSVQGPPLWTSGKIGRTGARGG